MKPVIIGISGSILVNKGDTFSGYKRAHVNQDYVEFVLRAGAIPFIIPFNEDLEITKLMVEKVDGVILSGGHGCRTVKLWRKSFDENRRSFSAKG